mgnify:CR=1 FL=1
MKIKRASPKKKWKVGDKNFHMTIKDIFRKKITKKNGQEEVVTKALVQCECGSKPKEIYLANFTRTKSCSTACWHTFHRHVKSQDLTGRWFGFLWIKREGPKEIVGKAGDKRSTWFVYCQSCNSYPDEPIRGSSITSGNAYRCSDCRTKKNDLNLIDLNNQSFGKLKVLREWGTRIRPTNPKAIERMWLCLCEGCGSTYSYQQNNLRSGNTRQCVDCGGQYDDNLDNFLLNDDYANAPCYYYIANVENKYLKPGIAENLKNRIVSSKGKYFGYYYPADIHKAELLTRAEAWTIEQLVLNASYSARPYSLDTSFANWGGSSELRDPNKVTLEQLVRYTKIAHEEVNRIGWRYIWVSKWKLPKLKS